MSHTTGRVQPMEPGGDSEPAAGGRANQVNLADAKLERGGRREPEEEESVRSHGEYSCCNLCAGILSITFTLRDLTDK